MNSYRSRRCGKYSLGGAVQTYHYDVRISDVDVCEYLRDNEDGIVSQLDEAVREHRCVKWYATMDTAFYRTTSDGEIQHTTGRFRAQPAVTSDSSELSADHMIDEFQHAIEAFIVDYVLDFNVTLTPFRPVHTNATTHRSKTCVVNVQNRNDELCFLYSILAHIHRVESERNPSRVCHYLAELVTTGLKFPLPVSDVAKFERLNEDIAVNVVT